MIIRTLVSFETVFLCVLRVLTAPAQCVTSPTYIHPQPTHPAHTHTVYDRAQVKWRYYYGGDGYLQDKWKPPAEAPDPVPCHEMDAYMKCSGGSGRRLSSVSTSARLCADKDLVMS